MSSFVPGCQPGQMISGANSIAISPDGENAYVAAITDNAVTTFDRDPATGELTQKDGAAGCINSDGAGGCTDGHTLAAPTNLVVSPDGENVYVVALSDNAISVLQRDTATGELSQAAGADGCISLFWLGNGCTQLDWVSPATLAISPDGSNVYAASGNAIAVLDRDPTDGTLTQKPGEAGCFFQTEIPGSCAGTHGMDGQGTPVVSPDGENVYVSFDAGSVLVFDRDTGTGVLTQKAGTDGCIADDGFGGLCADGRGLVGAISIAASDDGDNLYVAAQTLYSEDNTGSIALLDRDSSDGTVTQPSGVAGCFSYAVEPGCSSARAIGRPTSITVNPSGTNVYVASEQNDAVAAFGRDTGTGALSQSSGPNGCISNLLTGCNLGSGGGPGLTDPKGLAVSDDGQNLYTASSGALAALWIDALDASPSSFDFGDQLIAETSDPETVTLVNTGTASVTLDEVDTSGSQASDFTLSSNGCDNITLAHNDSCQLDVSFTPGGAGAREATLSFPDDTPGGGTYVALEGTGTGPTASITPASVSLAAATGGSSSRATVTVDNEGVEDLDVSSVSVTGVDAGLFSLHDDSCSGAAVSPSGSCTVDVQFNPVTDGSASATLEFADDAANSPQQVPLTGVGYPPRTDDWLTPVDISEPVPVGSLPMQGIEVQVGVDGNGNTTVLWTAGSDGAKVATRPPGGTFGEPQALSGETSAQPSLAVNESGDAVVAWLDSDAEQIEAAVRSGNGEFGTKQTISDADAALPSAAIDAEGNSLVVWGTSGNPAEILAAYAPAGDDFDAPEQIASDGQFGGFANAAFASNGNAVIAWTGVSGMAPVARATTRAADGTLGTPTTLSSAPLSAFPDVVSSGDGTALLSFLTTADPDVNVDGELVSYDIFGGFSTASVIAPGISLGSATQTFVPQLAVNSAGESLATWKSASLEAQGASGTGQVFNAPLALSSPAMSIQGQTSAIGGQGFVAWQQDDGNSTRVRAVVHDETFEGSEWISPPILDAGTPRLAADPFGNGVAVWSAEEAGTQRVQLSAYDGQSPALSSLNVPASGSVGQQLDFSVDAFDTWSDVTTVWDFGDGQQAVGDLATHAYDRAGSFDVTITATDEAGNSTQETRTVTITNAIEPPAPSTKLELTEFSTSRTCFTRRQGTDLSYRLSKTASVSIAFKRIKVAHARRCRVPKSARHPRRQRRSLTIQRSGQAGSNSFVFKGRSGRRALAPGRYRATIQASDATEKSEPKSVTFTIKR